MAGISSSRNVDMNARDLNQVGRDQHNHYTDIIHCTLQIDNAEGPSNPSGIRQQLRYRAPNSSCLYDSRISHSSRYTTLLLREGAGYPLWCPEPNESLPAAYTQRGIQIGDVGIIQKDTPFDHLFNITQAADHPLNSGGVPEGFVPLSLRKVDMNLHTHHRDGDSYVSAPKGSLSRIRIPDEDLQHRLDRAYEFEGSGDQGAILMLPAGSSLCKLESKAKFRAYAEQHASSWFRYAEGHRGREFPSDTNPTLYFVTGWEKCTSWGIASFVNPYEGQWMSPPFNVHEPPIGGYERYSWGHSNRIDCESRCHPNAQRSSGNDSAPPRNQCPFLLGFRVSVGRTSSQVSITDHPTDQSGPALVLNAFIVEDSEISTEPIYADCALIEDRDKDRRRRKRGGHSRSPGGGTTLIRTQDPQRIEVPFHPCDIINDFMLQVGSVISGEPDSEAPLIAISHDDDWIALMDGPPGGFQCFDSFEFLRKFTSRFTVVLEANNTISCKPSSESITRRNTARNARAGHRNPMTVSVERRYLPGQSVPSTSQEVRSTMVQTAQNPPTEKFTTRLNNYFQRPGFDPTSLTYNEWPEGPSNRPIWTVVCLINNESRGGGRAGTKREAKEAAAKEAYETLFG